MNTYVYLVRHAHSAYSSDEMGRGLSESGSRAVNKVTQLLKNESVDIVISSPYKRAVQTVSGIAEYLNIPVLMEEGFRERLISERPVEDFKKAMDRLWGDDSFCFHGGESNRAAQSRGVASLQSVLQSYAGKGIVVGTHGNIMTLIMSHFDNSFDYVFWKQLSMPDIYMLTFEGLRYIGAERIWRD